jgi:hypothetical protein
MVAAEDLHGRITAPVMLFFHEFGHHSFVVRLRDVQLVAQRLELLHLLSCHEPICECDPHRMLIAFENGGRAALALPGADGMEQEGGAQISWRVNVAPFPVFDDVAG